MYFAPPNLKTWLRAGAGKAVERLRAMQT